MTVFHFPRRLLLLLFFSFAAAQNSHDLASATHRALAVTSGKLHVKGLQRPVEVLRDRWGVAHIYAQNQHDLFFAQGVVAAQDRLFQMELWKRAGEGRLAEILGPSALPRDINARLLRYRGDMQREYQSYSPDAKEILRAFTDGINSYVANLTAPGGQGLPVEFQIAGFAPDAWHPEDCLNRLAAYSMTGNAHDELEHARAIATVGAERASKLFPFDPPVKLDPAPGVDFSELSPDLLKNLIGSDGRIEFPTDANASVGSNNWTVSGALTATARPILANDPHRVMALPSLRYMVHLSAPGRPPQMSEAELAGIARRGPHPAQQALPGNINWDVIGAGEPGLPGVALGHNQHIAWGFTIFDLDQQDLYIEELNPADPLEYKTETGWQRMEVRHETIRVKGTVPREVDLKFTRHGPVLWQHGKRALALRWSGSEPGTAGYLAALAVDRAENWDQFEAAMARWKLPPENLVYADTAGNIGEHSAGLVPIRKWTGLLPVPGSGAYEWQGFVPIGELPHFFNPKDGYVATANHRMIPSPYPYNVGFEWSSPERITRIRQVLDQEKNSQHKIAIVDMEALQTDITSLPALELREMVRSSSLENEPSLQSFLEWDGKLARDSADAALFEVWFRAIRNAVAGRLAGQNEYVRRRYQDMPADRLLSVLGSRSQAVPGEKPDEILDVAARDQVLSESLRSARQELAKLFGPDSKQWQWGKLHVIRFRHALDQQPGAKELFDPGPFARPGDGYTVNSTASSGSSWEQADGASYREILDTSNWDLSVAVNTPGQSGQPGSQHYSDLMGMWDQGQYFPLVYSRKAVEAATTERLRLEP
jgi:penicillin amidase